ncbi:MAG TPA: N-methyl-L-tryptophan oxidase [Myxococcota bacterium]|nr:N-methyl-L-tryptophan oxidase [Myxococcota bacterium]
MAAAHDVVVIGLGVMGAAALHACARRGLRVAGVERFDVPHSLGSSHGGSRVIRKAYYEDPRYVPLLEESWEAWLALERRSGEPLLLQTGGLHFGPADSPDLLAVQAAARNHGLAHELFDATALSRRFPQFHLERQDLALIERDAGVLLPERCVASFVSAALAEGAQIHARTRLRQMELGDQAVTLHLEGPTGPARLVASQVILALGPWWPEAPLPCPLPVTVTRQVQLWLRPRDPAAYLPARFPIFMRYAGRAAPAASDPLVYGLPEATFPGVKLAVHTPGDPTAADELDRELRQGDLEPVLAFMRRHLPDVTSDVLGARACLYTMSPDGHFGLGRHPESPRVLCALGFSGHGFKLAPAVGRILADLATDAGPVPELFALDRFS